MLVPIVQWEGSRQREKSPLAQGQKNGEKEGVGSTMWANPCKCDKFFMSSGRGICDPCESVAAAGAERLGLTNWPPKTEQLSPSHTQLLSNPSQELSQEAAAAASHWSSHWASTCVTTTHCSVQPAFDGKLQSGDEQGMSQSSTGHCGHALQSSGCWPLFLSVAGAAALKCGQKDGFIGTSGQEGSLGNGGSRQVSSLQHGIDIVAFAVWTSTVSRYGYGTIILPRARKARHAQPTESPPGCAHECHKIYKIRSA